VEINNCRRHLESFKGVCQGEIYPLDRHLKNYTTVLPELK
jgi:hypothetical protein